MSARVHLSNVVVAPVVLAAAVVLASCGGEPAAPTAAPSSSPTPSQSDIVLGAPYADAAEYKYVFPGYSTGGASGAPWGFEHEGLDFIIAGGGARVLAPAEGAVEQIELYQNPRNGQWQVNLRVRFNPRFAYDVLFEPRAPSQSVIADQRAAIPLLEGQRVTKGQLLGRILDLSRGDRSAGEPGIHFDVWRDESNVCPEPYFEPAARAGALALLHAAFPQARLCYP